MKSVAVSFLTTASIQALNLFSGILAARLLLAEGRGELAAILLWPGMIGAVAYMSLDQAVAFYGASRPNAQRRFFLLATIVSAPLAVLAVLGGYYILPVLMHAYNPDILALSRVYLLSIPFSYLGMTILGAFQGRQKFGGWNVIRFTPSAGYVAAILIFAAFGERSVQGFTLASLFSSMLAVGIGLTLLRPVKGAHLSRTAWADLPLLVRYSLGTHIPVLAGIANRQLDRALVALFLAPETLGVYVVALSTAALPRMIGGTIGPIAFTRVASQEDALGKARRFGRYFRLSLAVTTVALVPFALAGKWLIVFVFGSSFAMAGDLLPLLLVASFSHTMKHTLYFGLKAHAKLRAISVSEYLGLVTQLALLLVLLPRIGVMGAAWAGAISGAVGMVVGGIAMLIVAKDGIAWMIVPAQGDFTYVLRKMSLGRPTSSRQQIPQH